MAWVTQVCEPYCDANALMGQTWRPSGLDLACMLKSLHSLCAGHGWAPVGPQLNLPHVKMLFPTAPTRPITCNMGMRMPGVWGGGFGILHGAGGTHSQSIQFACTILLTRDAHFASSMQLRFLPFMPIQSNKIYIPHLAGWFDIVSLERSALEEGLTGNAPQPEGLRESVDYIHELIRKEVEAGIPEDRIVVGGFSQGGKVALCTMLDHVPALAGCVGLSTWLQPGVSVRSEQTLQRPFFLAHGSADPLLPPFLAQHTYDELHRLGTDFLLSFGGGWLGHFHWQVFGD